MKTFLKPKNWQTFLLGAAVMACCAPVLRAQQSPVGDWDFVISGNQRGVAQITFVSDFTLNGIEVITTKPVSTGTPTDDNPRGNIGDERTPGSEGGGGSSEAVTNFYGIAVLTGIWTYDAKGKVIGIITESGASTNSITNGISFRAITRPGSRMTMTAIRDGRKINYRGVPFQTLADFSGNYYGTGKRNGDSFIEMFTLTPSSDPVFGPLSLGNLYDVTGQGPAYPFGGAALISRQNYLGLASVSFENTNGTQRSIVGSFKLSKSSGTLTGVSSTEEDDEEVNVRLKINRQP